MSSNSAYFSTLSAFLRIIVGRIAGLEYLLLTICVCFGETKGLKEKSDEIGLHLASTGGECILGSILSRMERASIGVETRVRWCLLGGS